MCRMCGMGLWTILVLLAAGCSKSDGTGQAPAKSQNHPSATTTDGAASPRAKLDGPAAAAYDFLEAIRTADDEKTFKMLTAVAREKAIARRLTAMPSASDTAKFVVGKADYVDGGARVAFTWTDYDRNHKLKTDEAYWVLRHESEGWRIAGSAMQVFPDTKPLVLNFEDPDDMRAQMQWADQESRRREAAEQGQQAQEAENLEKNPRR
jgi:hypothetical protein